MLKWRKSRYDVNKPPPQRLHRLNSLENGRSNSIGEPLMCVWQALYIIQTAHEKDTERGIQADPQYTRVSVAALQKVTQTLAKSQYITYHPQLFQLRFQTPTVCFEEFRRFLYDTLCLEDVPCHALVESVEQQCWEVCREQYRSSHLDNTLLHKVWRLFNKLCQVGSWPPLICFIEASWLMDRMVELLGVPSLQTDDHPTEALSLPQLLAHLDLHLFLRSTPTRIAATVNVVYQWLGREVLKEGWMYKRTKKQDRSWTSWQCRWFSLTHSCLLYFTNEHCSTQKGLVEMLPTNQITDIEESTGNSKKYPNRFRVEKLKYKIELSSQNASDKEEWMRCLRMCGEALQEGSSPMMRLLDQRHTLIKQDIVPDPMEDPMPGTTVDLNHIERQLKSFCAHFPASPAGQRGPVQESSSHAGGRAGEHSSISSRCISIPSVADEDQQEAWKENQIEVVKEEDNIVEETEEENGVEEEVYEDESEEEEEENESAEKEEENETEDDEDTLEIDMDKLKVLFCKVDKDGNGKIDLEEFCAFISSLEKSVSVDEAKLLFLAINADNSGYVSFTQFHDYFVEFIMGETSESECESKLRAAFLAADRDRKGKLNFHRFAEHAFKRRQTFSMTVLDRTFKALDRDQSGDICFKEFREFFSRQSLCKRLAPLKEVQSEEASKDSTLETVFKEVYKEADAKEMVTFLCRRWEKFKTFRREGVSGDTVMSGAHGIVNDHLPGDYSLLDLACFNDLPPLAPQYTVIEGVKWTSSLQPGSSGNLLFPDGFDGEIATDLATTETLAFYGCTLAEGNQLKVSLLFRHGIQDFTYENSYLDKFVAAKGGGVERHAFAHLDCPLDVDSGIIVIAKLEDDNNLFVTGFKIPLRHTLYVPPNIIHSNDYLRGTWRTMLSDEADIDHVLLTKHHNQDNPKQFTFTFKPLPL